MRQQVEQITYDAGKLLMSYFKKPDLKIVIKADNSPVTEADWAVSDFFREKLAPLNIPVVTEENFPPQAPEGDFFIIDPLDGTRYFIDQAEHFAILIALISGGRPTMGFCYFPAMNVMFSAEKGHGAFFNGSRIQHTQMREKLIAFSLGFHKRPEAAALMKKMNIHEIREQESALKMGYMARGDVDFYPRFGNTYEWDTAAGQIVLEEGGCEMFDVHTMQPMKYGKPNYKNRGFVAFRRDLEPLVRDMLKDLELKK